MVGFPAHPELTEALEAASYALPLSYAYDALERIATDGALGGGGAADVAVVAFASVLALVLGALTLRRRTP